MHHLWTIACGSCFEVFHAYMRSQLITIVYWTIAPLTGRNYIIPGFMSTFLVWEIHTFQELILDWVFLTYFENFFETYKVMFNRESCERVTYKILIHAQFIQKRFHGKRMQTRCMISIAPFFFSFPSHSTQHAHAHVFIDTNHWSIPTFARWVSQCQCACAWIVHSDVVIFYRNRIHSPWNLVRIVCTRF